MKADAWMLLSCEPCDSEICTRTTALEILADFPQGAGRDHQPRWLGRRAKVLDSTYDVGERYVTIEGFLRIE